MTSSPAHLLKSSFSVRWRKKQQLIRLSCSLKIALPGRANSKNIKTTNYMKRGERQNIHLREQNTEKRRIFAVKMTPYVWFWKYLHFCPSTNRTVTWFISSLKYWFILMNEGHQLPSEVLWSLDSCQMCHSELCSLGYGLFIRKGSLRLVAMNFSMIYDWAGYEKCLTSLVQLDFHYVALINYEYWEIVM